MTAPDPVDPALQMRLSTLLARHASTIHAASRLREDLGADSMDLVELAMDLETDHGIRIDDAELERLETVADVQALLARKADLAPTESST